MMEKSDRFDHNGKKETHSIGILSKGRLLNTKSYIYAIRIEILKGKKDPFKKKSYIKNINDVSHDRTPKLHKIHQKHICKSLYIN